MADKTITQQIADNKAGTPRFEEFYTKASTKYVKTIIVYADSSNALFYDESHENAIPSKFISEIFFAGCVAKKGSVFYRALSFDGTAINFGFPS